MNKKFELTDEKLKFDGHILYRIKALQDFGDVKKGDLGGWVESEKNLSHEGTSWIYDDAKAYEKSWVWGNARIYDKACIFGKSWIYNNAKIYDNVKVYGKPLISGWACIYGNCDISGSPIISDTVRLYDNVKVRNDAKVLGYAYICHNAIIEKDSDYLVFKNPYSRFDMFTYIKSSNKWASPEFYLKGSDLIKLGFSENPKSGKTFTEYVKLVKFLNKVNKSK